MYNFENITVLLNQNKFDEAMKEIDIALKDDLNSEDKSKLFYLKGKMYRDYRYESKNENKARREFLNSIQCDKPFHKSYSEYSELIEDKHVIKSILTDGLKKYPKSSDILVKIIYEKVCSLEEVEILILEANYSEVTIFSMIQVLFEKKYYETITKLIPLHKDKITDSNGKMQVVLVEAISYFMIGKTEEVKLHAKSLIDQDTHNFLSYMHYLLYASNLIKMGDIENGLIFFNQIPVNSCLEDFFDGPNYRMTIFFEDEVKNIFDQMYQIKLKENETIKIKAIHALYLFKPSESFDIIRYTENNRRDLIEYDKKYPGNADVLSAIYRMSIQLKEYFDSYLTIFSMVSLDINPTDYFCYLGSDITDFQQGEVVETTTHLLLNYKLVLDKDPRCLMENIVDPLIDKIYSSDYVDKYVLINKLSSIFENNDMFKYSSMLFQVAYSLNNTEEMIKAEKYYSYILKNNESNHSVINNLGVIFYEKGDYVRAEEFYLKAFNLDKTSELYKNNYLQLKSKNQIRKHAVENLFLEPMIRVARIFRIYEIIYEDKFILNNYSDIDVMIYKIVSQDEFENMIDLEYFEFISEVNGQRSYQKNLYVKKILAEYKKIIELNSHMENFTLNDYKNLGYNMDLISQINLIQDLEYSDIIIKDINECVNSILIKNDKSAIVLAGSITEAVLMYQLKQNGITTINVNNKNKPIANCSLQDLIDEAQRINILNARNYYSAHIVRDYRNFIHPDKMIRERAVTNNKLVSTIWNLLKEIINELLPPFQLDY